MMNKKNIIKLLVLYILLFVLGTLCLIACFHISLFNKITDVLFYRGIVLIIIWGAIISLIMFLIRRNIPIWNKIITVRDIILLFVGFCSIQLLFFTHLPVTAERSISVFMLGYMADNYNQTYTEDDIKHYFIDKYVNEYGAFDKRFHEQIETGTIKKTNDGYCITKQGRNLMRIYEIIADLFNIDKKLIHSSN